MRELFRIISNDAYRYTGNKSIISLIKLYVRTPGFKYTCWMRFVKYCRSSKLLLICFPFAYFMYRHYMFKYGIIIPYRTSIGPGFYIGHFGNIVINSNVLIGKNVNISHGVTIGQGGDDKAKGCPIIGDNVYIGPNSTIIGAVIIGNNAAVGANAFVNKDVLPSVSVGGVPAKIISRKGSINYIHNMI